MPPTPSVALERSDLRSLIASQVVPVIASFGIAFVSAALLGTSGRGHLVFVTATAALAGTLFYGSGHVGVVQAVRAGYPSATRYGLGYGLFVFVLATILAGVSLVAGFDWPSIAGGAVGGALLIVGSGLNALNLIVLRVIQGLGRSRQFRNAMLIQSLGYLAAGVLAAALTRRPTPVEWAWLTSLAVSTLYGLRHMDLSTRSRMPASGTRLMLRTAISAHIGTWGQQLLFRADLVTLGLIGSAASLGVYSIASPIAGVVWTLSEALSLAAYGSRTALNPADLEFRRTRLIRLNLRLGLIAAVAIGAASFLVPLMLHGYKAVPMLVLILLPGTVIQGAARIGLTTLVAREQTGAVVLIGVVSASLAALYVPFVWVAGAYGAAIASTMIYLIQTLVVTAVSNRLVSRSRDVRDDAARASVSDAQENVL